MTEVVHQHDWGLIAHGDCLSAMKELADNSVDSIITDPPYGLEFMGREWDYGIPGEPFWREALRVAKPGAHLLAFGGTRTYHRLACAIEDAGWEVRDCIMWVYGSGFPKSLDVSKAIDKANGRDFEDRYELGRHIREQRERLGISRKEVNERFGAVAVCNHWEAQDRNNALPPTPKDWEVLKEWLGCDSRFDALVDRIGAEREVVGVQENAMSNWSMDGETKFADRDITAPATEAAQRWNGWGTSLKPAYEPIIVARKPLSGTVAATVCEHGTGALNIDGCRVGTGDDRTAGGMSGSVASDVLDDGFHEERRVRPEGGRWPANLVHDGSDEVVGLFPRTTSGKAAKGGHKRTAENMEKGSDVYGGGKGIAGTSSTDDAGTLYGDSGSAARFFYCAKASKKDRGEGNKHPTVKPTALMEYLVRLVTPPGGLVLDPFGGSGTTAIAAKREGFRSITIDNNREYCEIAKTRMDKEYEDDVEEAG